MATNLKPFRDYDEHEVINLFAVAAESANKGSVVMASASGVNLKDQTSLDNLSPYANTLSAQYNVPWTVSLATSGTAKGSLVGLLLKDVRKYDENGELLIYRPRKAAEMDVIITGQACPILTRGIVLFSGITTGTPAYGSGAAVSDTVAGEVKVVPYANATVGKFLGPVNNEGYALLKVEL